MRIISIAILFATAGCSRQFDPAELQEPSFDGAAAVHPAAVLKHGERLTWVLGCRGCHGDQLQGERFAKDHPEYGPIYASNLTRVMTRYSDREVETILREGKHPVRKVVWAMPSEMFYALSREDMTALLAYLRSLPPRGEATPAPQFSAIDRKDIASGDYKPAPGMIAEAKKNPAIDLGIMHRQGRYIAVSACTECHSSNLGGRPHNTPDLVVASGYSRDDFERLMTTGMPIGGRKLRMMDGVARGRFSHLTPHERDELYAYLKARAEQAR